MDFEGTGEILQVIAEPQDGAARSHSTKTGHRDRNVHGNPFSYVIQRAGASREWSR